MVCIVIALNDFFPQFPFKVSFTKRPDENEAAND